ncbi:MAG: InlB B-repeat-containing protein [Spirochaetaceae bacterium]|jgi:uncharacterized repeat protein (TIGR02543 family)|nr:InlB B-repeat-containing protein [Spirochaetaceae bacterium]
MMNKQDTRKISRTPPTHRGLTSRWRFCLVVLCLVTAAAALFIGGCDHYSLQDYLEDREKKAGTPSGPAAPPATPINPETPTVIYYTVTYHANGGDGPVPGAQTVQEGEGVTIAEGEGLWKSGYAFAGWSADAEDAEPSYLAGASMTPEESLTLYAVWTANTYTVTYSTADGCTVSPASKTVTYNSPYALDVPVREHYTFIGWYAESVATGAQLTGANGASLTPWAIADNTTVYAAWTANIYPDSMIFDFNGVTVDGSVSVSKQHAFSAADIPWPVKAQTGMVFLGWYDADTGGTLQSAADILACIGLNKTFYAHWYAVAGPWAYDSATGGMVANYAYTGAAAAWTPAAVDGTIAYTFEAWGAAGGNASSEYGGSHTGGAGGYSKGTLSVASGSELYFYVGAAASTFNGGGDRGTVAGQAGPATYGARGGGASSISLSNNTWNNATVLARRILVAGGGGGADFGNGRVGGGLSGASGGAATGGTQTTGGTGDTAGAWGAGGKGGSCNNTYYTSGGGGGGGYYGGAGSSGLSYGTGGGGGSGYVFGLAGCGGEPGGENSYHLALLADFPEYQFSEGVTVQSGGAGWVDKPTAAGSNGYIRVSYIPPGTAE